MLLIPVLAFGQSIGERPMIGISCGKTDNQAKLNLQYSNAVIKAGGTPVLIPVTTDSLALRGILHKLDGIILSGGEDVDPARYEEMPHPKLGSVNSVRDTCDFLLAHMAHNLNIPMLGICRGEQLINVAFGGSLYQDIPSQCPQWKLSHRARAKGDEARHVVNFAPDSQLAAIFGTTELQTNSYHHQAVKDPAKGFRVVAWAADGTPEAIESVHDYPIWGVQFHPEKMVAQGDKVALRIFEFFVRKADTFRRAKAIHRRIISVDTHTDAPGAFKKNYNIANRTSRQFNIPKMEEGMLDGQYLACWVKQGVCDEAGIKKATNRVNLLISRALKQIEMNSDRVELARTPADLARIKAAGKKAVFLSVENAYGLGFSLADFERMHQAGVTCISFCHSANNHYCDSSSDTVKRWNGLSPLGRDAVREMNRLGIIIDVSHASDDTFWQLIKYSEKPIIASHSSSRAIFDHDRNLTDDQLRALAEKGGVAQACIVDIFITPQKAGTKPGHGDATLSHFMKHLLHMIKVAGIDHVGIGSDFDGGGGVYGCRGDNDLINITVRLLEEGFSEADIAKIWGGNFLRVMTEVQKK